MSGVYKNITAYSIRELDELVNQCMKDTQYIGDRYVRWNPVGGVTIIAPIQNSKHHTYNQTMVWGDA